ncbi:hypothetical protein V2J09_000038 [Rumex salicifolius]
MGQIQYSDKYFDDVNEYRHVVLPPEVAKLLPKNRLLSEVAVGNVYNNSVYDFSFPLLQSLRIQLRHALNEWRAIGVQQSRGWVHYAIHRPEPHIMLFRRPLNYQQQNQNQA